MICTDISITYFEQYSKVRGPNYGPKFKTRLLSSKIPVFIQTIIIKQKKPEV